MCVTWVHLASCSPVLPARLPVSHLYMKLLAVAALLDELCSALLNLSTLRLSATPGADRDKKDQLFIVVS